MCWLGLELPAVLKREDRLCGQGTDSGSYRYGNGLLSREVFESLDPRLQEALS